MLYIVALMIVSIDTLRGASLVYRLTPLGRASVEDGSVTIKIAGAS